MKLLVVSDSHGQEALLRRVMLTHKDAECTLHLGDGAPAFLTLAAELGMPALAVGGNCDLFSDPAAERMPWGVYPLGEHRIFYTHGHLYRVEWGMEALVHAAREQNCTVALFGHTHIPEVIHLPAPEGDPKGHPLILMNPGSISRPRNGSLPGYGLVQWIRGQLLVNTAPLLP